MKTLPTPHGDKLIALLENEKLPESDKQAVRETLDCYKKWLSESLEVKGKDYKKVDEVIILRKAKRLSSNIRQEFNLYANRKKKRAFYEKFLKEHPLAADAFIRFLKNIERQLRDDTEAKVLERGYF